MRQKRFILWMLVPLTLLFAAVWVRSHIASDELWWSGGRWDELRFYEEQLWFDYGYGAIEFGRRSQILFWDDATQAEAYKRYRATKSSVLGFAGLPPRPFWWAADRNWCGFAYLRTDDQGVGFKNTERKLVIPLWVLM